MTDFTSRKWMACQRPGCEGGADIVADTDSGRRYVALSRAAGAPAFVYGESATCNVCGDLVPMPTATAEQMDAERNPLVDKLKGWGLLDA